MIKVSDSVAKRGGPGLPGVVVSLLTYPGGLPVTLYSDDGLTVQNTVETTDREGNYEFYVPEGNYSFRFTYKGVLRKQIDDVSVGPAEALDVSATQAKTYDPGTQGAHYNDAPSVRDLPYNVNNTGDQSAKFSTIRAVAKSFTIPAGTYQIDSAPASGPASFLVSPNATFSGAGAPNGLPDFTREFWPDTGVGANVWRFTDRMFVGRQFTGNRLGAQDAEYDGQITSIGPDYLFRDATFLCFSKRGQIAVSGYSRSNDTPYAAYVDCIGVSGGVQNNRVSASLVPAWGLYSDLQHEVTNGTTFGLEIAAKDKSGVTKTLSPFGIVEGGMIGSGVIGIHLAAGGAAPPGGAATNDSNTAINITQNSINTAWRVGINFANGAVSGNSGNGSGDGDAIRMPTGDRFRWMSSTTNTIASLWAQSTTAAAAVHQKFGANKVEWLRDDGTKNVFQVTSSATSVNYLNVSGSATGAAVTLLATGDDANVPVGILTKGTGNFSVNSNNGAATVLQVLGSTTATDYAQISGASGGGSVLMQPAGSTANVSLLFAGKGTGGVILRDGGGANKISINTTGIGEFGAAPVARPTYGAPTGTATRTTFDTTTVTTQQLAERVKAMIDDSRSRGSYA